MEYDQAYVADYADSSVLRAQQLRLSRLQYGSTNISPHGHPQKTGVVNQGTLCAFKPRDGVCTQTAATIRPSQLAVRRQIVQSQVNGSFRSAERNWVKKVEQSNRLQQARCAKLLSDS